MYDYLHSTKTQALTVGLHFCVSSLSLHVASCRLLAPDEPDYTTNYKTAGVWIMQCLRWRHGGAMIQTHASAGTHTHTHTYTQGKIKWMKGAFIHTQSEYTQRAFIVLTPANYSHYARICKHTKTNMRKATRSCAPVTLIQLQRVACSRKVNAPTDSLMKDAEMKRDPDMKQTVKRACWEIILLGSHISFSKVRLSLRHLAEPYWTINYSYLMSTAQ